MGSSFGLYAIVLNIFLEILYLDWAQKMRKFCCQMIEESSLIAGKFQKLGGY